MIKLFIFQGPFLETCLHTQENKTNVLILFSFYGYNLVAHWSQIITLSLLKQLFIFANYCSTCLVLCNSNHLNRSNLYFHYPCSFLKNYLIHRKTTKCFMTLGHDYLNLSICFTFHKLDICVFMSNAVNHINDTTAYSLVWMKGPGLTLTVFTVHP